MIVAALPASQPRFRLASTAPEQEADVLTNSPSPPPIAAPAPGPPIAATERTLPLRSPRQDCRHPPQPRQDQPSAILKSP
jgi:hypothetical protein